MLGGGDSVRRHKSGWGLLHVCNATISSVLMHVSSCRVHPIIHGPSSCASCACPSCLCSCCRHPPTNTCYLQISSIEAVQLLLFDYVFALYFDECLVHLLALSLLPASSICPPPPTHTHTHTKQISSIEEADAIFLCPLLPILAAAVTRL